MRGWILIPASFVLEQFRLIREAVWSNAGFSSLRKIRNSIEDYEPRHDPTVVPLDYSLLLPPGPSPARENGNGGMRPTGSSASASASPSPSPSAGPTATAHPVPHTLSPTGYYSAKTYRELYLQGSLTPTAVAVAILPLIRRDVHPKGSHHLLFFETNTELVLKSAAESTHRYREGRSLGPLDGVPCAVKDEFDLDGYKCCLGSVNDYTADSADGDGCITSWCVNKLLEAGVVILGKTSMVEFGLDTPGNNPNYGTPRNPFNEDYYTGGSSSGTAAAIGSGLVPIGLGSDGGGSIRIPSAFCGIFGLKPSHARVSSWPSANHSNTCAVLGPMASDMESLATIFDIIGQPHPDSPFDPPIVPRLPPAAKMLKHTPGRPKVLGVSRAWFNDCAPAVRRLCDSMVDKLVAEHGYHVVEVDIPFLAEGQLAHAMTVLTDASTLLPEYNNLTYATRILLALGRTTPATDYLLAQKLRRCLMSHLAHLWRQHPGMIIVTPTTACAGWRIRDKGGELSIGISDGDRTIESMRYVWLGNFCGLPSISVPAGYASPDATGKGDQVADKETEGKIPVGLLATGEWASEEGLIKFGVDAENSGVVDRERPGAWVDVVKLARKADGIDENHVDG